MRRASRIQNIYTKTKKITPTSHFHDHEIEAIEHLMSYKTHSRKIFICFLTKKILTLLQTLKT